MDLRASLVLITASLLFSVAKACSNGDCKLLDPCSSDGDCQAGLYCFSCPLEFSGRRCVRSTTTNQFKLLNNTLPFNKYAFLTTHNAYAIEGEPSHTGVPRITFTNQEDNITQQLNEPAIDTLKEIEAFLSANPTEIVTVILEDYVQAPKGLTKVFTDAGLIKYWFPLKNMPKNGQDWPLVSDMVANNQRLLVFTSIMSKEESEGIAYQWNYMVENQYGDGGMHAGNCPNRTESSPLDDRTKSLVLVNYFPTIPFKQIACEHNSANLINMLHTCFGAAGNRWANFVAVNFYKRSDGGGAFQALDTLNGELLCGCDDVHACVNGSTSSACNHEINVDHS
ncbi:PI-PLC X domain-containing protein At5g67130-like isoform X2 [Quercus robur]|nr:PI-PLC X domain-containing protein At5g67130-like isoform X2 [Quercus robur]